MFNEFPLITIDPNILRGKPTFTGTRISVQQVIQMLSTGIEVEEILLDFPRLTRKHISQGLAYSAQMIGFHEKQLTYA